MAPDLVTPVDWIDAAIAVADLLDSVGAALAGKAYASMRDEPGDLGIDHELGCSRCVAGAV